MKNIDKYEQYMDKTFPIINTPLQQRYDKIAAKWNSDVYEGTRRDDLIPTLIEAAKIRGDEKILEAMSGTALLSKEIHVNYPECKLYALDFSRGMLNFAADQIHKIQASVLAMPFANHSFDIIFLRSALYDLPKRFQLKGLQEIRRVLKPGGRFIFQTYYSPKGIGDTLNKIVNMKDLVSGQYQDIGREHPRYFATLEELTEWFEQAGFLYREVQKFEGYIRYLQTNEMNELGKRMWIKYITALPEAIKEKLKLKWENDQQELVYTFPGVIYVLFPK